MEHHLQICSHLLIPYLLLYCYWSSFIPYVLDYQQQIRKLMTQYALTHLFLHRRVPWMATFRCKFLYSLFCVWLLAYLVQLNSDSQLRKKKVLFPAMIALQKLWKCFSFHLKSSFRSQDISIFVLLFWACRKGDLIRRMRLVFKFMMSQPG